MDDTLTRNTGYFILTRTRNFWHNIQMVFQFPKDIM